MNERRKLAAAVAVAAGLAAPAAGMAAMDQSGTLEEVVVTASKREQSAQDVAVSLTAISGDMLERQHATDATDLNGIAPNVQLQAVGAFQNAAAFFIRGVGSTDIESATDPGIATFVDEIYQGRTSTALVDFLDIASVEVLRGPQGSLFGRNSIGGVVHIKHEQPQFDAPMLELGVSAGNYGRRNAELIANYPVSNELAFRVAGKTTNHDGYYENDFGDEDVSGQQRVTVLPSMMWAPTQNFDLLVRGEYNRTRDDSYGNTPYTVCRQDPRTAPPFAPGNDTVINVIAAPEALGGFGQPGTAASYCTDEIGDDSRDVRHNQGIGSFSDFDTWGVTTEANYRVPDIGTFSYIANYRDVEEDVYNDFDATQFFLFETRRQQDHYQTSHELRFNADLSERFELVTGAYYFEQEYTLEQDTLGGLVGGQIFGRSEQFHQNWALFGQLDYFLTDSLTAIVGMRYNQEEKDFDHCGVGAGDPATRTCQLVVNGMVLSSDTSVQATESWSNVSPKLGLQYFFAPEKMVYATWARGFRSGGFNGRATSPTSIGPFDEEQADNYEVGLKSQWLDGRMRLNLAAFWLVYEDLQRAVIRPTPTGGGGQETVTENVGSAENRGVELELNALLLPDLTLDLSVGYLDASNDEWCAPLQGVRDTDTVPTGFEQCAPSEAVTDEGGKVTGFLVPIDASGLEPAQSPEWSTRVSLAYQQHLSGIGNVTYSGSYRYQSSANLVSAGLPPGTTDGITNFDGVEVSPERESHGIVDLNVSWRSVDDRYQVSGFVNNVTDETYISTGTFVAGLFNFVKVNQPRHWGIEARVNFGE